jgi:CRP-like cAMP-binding protein
MTAEPKNARFDPAAFLAKAGLGRRIVQLKPKQLFFSQVNPADSIFFLQKGRAKITVVSKKGKEATITFSLLATSSGKNRLPERPVCACRRPLRSKSSGLRCFA